MVRSLVTQDNIMASQIINLVQMYVTQIFYVSHNALNTVMLMSTRFKKIAYYLNTLDGSFRSYKAILNQTIII